MIVNAKFIGMAHPILQKDRGYQLEITPHTKGRIKVEVQQHRGKMFILLYKTEYKNVVEFFNDWDNVRARSN